MAILEKIQVQLELLTAKFTKPMQEANKSVKDLNKQVFAQSASMRDMSSKARAATQQISTFRDQNMGFSQVMNMSMERFKAFNGQGLKFTTVGGRMANGMRKLTHGMRGFRMEALGVMFFGMSLQRMFAGLLKPVSEAFGVFDLFRLMLLVLFLPVMEMLFPILLAIMEWFMNLSPGVKKAIGIFVLLGLVFGTILMIVGTFILGLGSLILMWPLISAAAGAAMIAIAAAFLPVMIVIAIIIAIVVGMRLAWKSNFLGMKKLVTDFISGIKDFFKGLFLFFKGFWQMLKGLFTGDSKLMWEGVKNIFKGAVQAIWGLLKILVNGIAMIIVGVIKIFFNVVKAIVDFWIELPQHIWNAIKGIGKLIKKAFTAGIPDWILKMLKGGGNILKGIGGKIGNFFSGSEDDFVWRPGQGPVSINPNDTLVGFKGSPPNLGGGGSSGSTTNNFYGFTMNDLKRELDERDRNMVSQMERNR